VRVGFTTVKVILLIGLLTFLAFAALRHLPLLSSNALKGYLEARLQQQFNLPVHINRVRIGLLPDLRLRMLGLAVLDRDETTPLFQAKEVSAVVKLLPLVSKRVVLDSLLIQQPYAELCRDSTGMVRLRKGAAGLPATGNQLEALLAGLSARELLIKRGMLDIVDEQDPVYPVRLEFRDIHLLARSTAPYGFSFAEMRARLGVG